MTGLGGESVKFHQQGAKLRPNVTFRERSSLIKGGKKEQKTAQKPWGNVESDERNFLTTKQRAPQDEKRLFGQPSTRNRGTTCA